MSKIADTVTYVDEAGLNGLVRNLTPEQDDEISLLCALPIPIEHVNFCRNEVKKFYDVFCEAAPPESILHITDAFAEGNKTWRKAAENARQGIFEIVRRHRIYVVYAARRARIARKKFCGARRKTIKSCDRNEIYRVSNSRPRKTKQRKYS
ncbi:hypothetical protein [Elstera litoralis]|uniref:hypothetical protein n=1 Tax=Elstera litoralis TaxID=552518 RepID=UPI0012EECF13|nr:hypothetical protein [Elstera litoralis]